MENKENILSDQQVEQISKELEELRSTDPELKVIADLPSNNNIEESINPETGVTKMVNVSVNPETGEHIIVGEAEEKESFEEACERLDSDIDFDVDTSAPITIDEMEEYVKNNENDSVFKEFFNEEVPDTETMMGILDVVNRKMNKEEFNVYKALPEKVQQMISKYVGLATGAPNLSNQSKMARNMIAESIIDQFITDISIDRVKNDLSKEVEQLFEKSSAEIADEIIGYTTERNKQYRDYAATIEDDYKRVKMIKILDQIDEAYNLTELKEFCKKCKIKHIDIEKPTEKSYQIDRFLDKYNESSYNIYSIYTAEITLIRNLNNKGFECTAKEVRAFFLAFCKQCMNYSASDVFQHSYMYYVIYNIILSDINTGDKKEVSSLFLDNVIECINNLKVRNNF